MNSRILHGSCNDLLTPDLAPVHLTFLDPPFNQDKDYAHHDDALPEDVYWAWMANVCASIRAVTAPGGALYFMQREKNAEFLLRTLRETGWTLQNLIVWKKMTSAVPSNVKYGKHYQVIAFATHGTKPRLFHKLRIDPPLLPHHKIEREKGVFVTDVWDDIRELTSGYFAGDEALRTPDGERFHKQQAPIALLLRVLLSSSRPGDTVLDPFAGTGTTLVVAQQLGRRAVGIELDAANVACIQTRLASVRRADRADRFYRDYLHTDGLEHIWGEKLAPNGEQRNDVLDLPLFRPPEPP